MGSGDRRIVLLGRTGVGKSSAGNTIFGGEAVFHTKCSPVSTTHTCESETRTVGGREITLIDPPGFFDTEIPDEDALRREMLRCITECAPGPHAFLIVLKVGKFTKQEKEVVEKIEQYFSPETFKYAAVLFTHGYQLKGKTVEEFVELNAELSALVGKCGGRCHVLDNKYWKKKNEEEEEEEEEGRYASNTLQVARILQTIDKMAEEKMAEDKMAEEEEKNGGCYTNEMLRAVHEGTQAEMEEIRRESGGEDMPEKEVKKKAKKRVHRKLIKCVGIATGALLGALLGVAVVAEVSVTVLFKKAMAEPVAAGGGVAAAAAGVAAAAASGGGALAVAAGVAVAAAALLGAAEGGWVGAEAAEGAETVGQAAKRAGKATRERAAAKRTAMLDKALEGMKIEKASSSSSSSSSSKDEKQKADSKKE